MFYSKIKVVADSATGNAVSSKDGSEWGYVRLEQVRTVINKNGFTDKKVVSMLLKGKVEELSANGYYVGQELPGTLIVEESLMPFDTASPERDLKVAGDTGIICKKGDNPIYRKTFYTPIDNAQDIQLIQHTNTEELREAWAAQTAKPLSANTDFDNL
jgi:hypothetical protein